MGRSSRIDSHSRWVFAVAGGIAGLLILAIVLIMRSQRNDTLVLEVGTDQDPTQIRVYVGGGVNTPGIYTLPRGSRVADAIDAAGGLATGADISELGMGAILDDSDQILVAVAETSLEPAGAGTPAAESATTMPSAGGAGPVNINAAGTTELETLPRIGPVLAERIVEYRLKNGPFQSVDELEEVRGISGAMVEELRPLVVVGP